MPHTRGVANTSRERHSRPLATSTGTGPVAYDPAFAVSGGTSTCTQAMIYVCHLM